MGPQNLTSWKLELCIRHLVGSLPHNDLCGFTSSRQLSKRSKPTPSCKKLGSVGCLCLPVPLCTKHYSSQTPFHPGTAFAQPTAKVAEHTRKKERRVRAGMVYWPWCIPRASGETPGAKLIAMTSLLLPFVPQLESVVQTNIRLPNV